MSEMAKASGIPREEPHLPHLGEATRTVIVTYGPPDWEVSVERPDWVSPHEAWAMLDAAGFRVAEEVPEWNRDGRPDRDD